MWHFSKICDYKGVGEPYKQFLKTVSFFLKRTGCLRPLKSMVELPALRNNTISWFRNFKNRLFDDQVFHCYCFPGKMLNYQFRGRVICFVIRVIQIFTSWFQKSVIRWAGFPLPLLPKAGVELPASRLRNLFWSNTNFVIC